MWRWHPPSSSLQRPIDLHINKKGVTKKTTRTHRFPIHSARGQRHFIGRCFVAIGKTYEWLKNGFTRTVFKVIDIVTCSRPPTRNIWCGSLPSKISIKQFPDRVSFFIRPVWKLEEKLLQKRVVFFILITGDLNGHCWVNWLTNNKEQYPTTFDDKKASIVVSFLYRFSKK